MSMKINRLEIENVKRIKAVKLEPVQNGLTIIGGDNQQGKTSVLDPLRALGGERYQTFPEYKGRLHGAAELTYCDEQWFGSGT